MKLNEVFRKFAARIASVAGNPWAFIIALLLIALWATSGPFFDFSNRWQLVINTGTTIVTLLMVFLIQNTQNRDSKATHLKLDELIKAVKGARSSLVDIENLPDEVLEEFHEEFRKIQEKYSGKIKEKPTLKSSKTKEILNHFTKVIEKPLTEKK